MKKIIIGLFFLGITRNLSADQLAWITFSQAKEATDYLTKQKEVILWCACCDGERKTRVTVSRVSYVKVTGEEYYQVVLEGTDSDGKAIKEFLDLAYVHVKINNEAKALGQVLNYDCDPCTKPFSWK